VCPGIQSSQMPVGRRAVSSDPDSDGVSFTTADVGPDVSRPGWLVTGPDRPAWTSTERVLQEPVDDGLSSAPVPAEDPHITSDEDRIAALAEVRAELVQFASAPVVAPLGSSRLPAAMVRQTGRRRSRKAWRQYAGTVAWACASEAGRGSGLGRGG
jgi:hypothetical protein